MKKKLTQLKLSEDIIIHESKVERSQITGALVVKMKKLNSHEFLRRNKEIETKRVKEEEERKKKEKEDERTKRLRLCDEYEKRIEK